MEAIRGVRQIMAWALGHQYDGQRDVYKAAGYDKQIELGQYNARFARQDIASRVVNAPADETWRVPPDLVDGPDLESAQTDSDFLNAWESLVNGREGVESEMLGIWHYLNEVDRLTGIGQYGVLVLGLKDSKSLEESVDPNSLSGPESLVYLQAYTQAEAKIEKKDEDVRSSRFRKPVMYSLQSEGAASIRVHWTRVIHVAEGGGTFGAPRMEPVWNRLFDLEKILAASGESAYSMMQPDYIASTKDDYEVDPESDLTEQIDDYIHGFRRWLELEGYDVKRFAGSIVDPTAAAMCHVKFISGATQIPQRILIGAEAGHLASSQDETNWAKVVSRRQKNFAEPVILRRLINRLIWSGVLPTPSSGVYSVNWRSLFEQDDHQLSEIGKNAAVTLSALGAQADPESFVKAYFPHLEPTAVSMIGIPELGDNQSQEM